FRALQGLGGGAIIPTAQSILFARYPQKEHGMAAALFGLGAITGPLFGPTIGGYLIEWSSWHWIFMVNVPMGAIATLLTLRFIEEPGFVRPSGAAAKIDVFGIALLATGMASLQYVLEEGNREGWFDSRLVLALSAVAAIALITFIVHELETEHPVVDLRVFKNTSYAAGTGLNFLTGFALFSGSYMFSLFAGSVIHYSALDIGKVFLVAGTVSVVVMPVMGRLAPRVDGRILLGIGVTVVALSQYVASHLTQAAGFWDLVSPNMIRSFGLGFIFIPVSVLALSSLSPSQRGNATGLFNLTRELGGSLGTALMGMLVSDDIKRFGSYLGENLSPTNPILQEQMGAIASSVGAQTAQRDLVAESVLSMRVMRQAMVQSFENGFRWTAFAMSLGLILLLFLRRPRNAGPVAGAH
ncbi:MAG TPA: DHA2 family efflux MFS transporter permease subunit, partial [Polyangiaceae bacterium]|nr:DHA2 family efflux MFS transporter permease subunit [Polyangiaceae bacterium]